MLCHRLGRWHNMLMLCQRPRRWYNISITFARQSESSAKGHKLQLLLALLASFESVPILQV